MQNFITKKHAKYSLILFSYFMRNKFYAIINTLSTTIKKGRKYIHSVDLLNGKITVTIKTLQVDAFKNRSKLRTIEQIFITKNT